MSTPTMQPMEPPEQVPPLPRTRLKPLGGSGKSVRVMLVCLILSVVGAIASRSYAKGGAAYISANAPGASVRVDDAGRQANASGAVQFVGLPFGQRRLQIQHPDFEPLTATIHMAWLSSNQFSFHLTAVPLTLTVNTNPGASVFLNGQAMGIANNQGILVKSGVTPGDYDIEVSLTGYNAFRQHRHLSPRFAQIYAQLYISQERIQALQEEQRRAQQNAAQFQQLFASAQREFNSRQYQPALAAIDEALKLEPGNQPAQQLRSRIVQTINILR